MSNPWESLVVLKLQTQLLSKKLEKVEGIGNYKCEIWSKRRKKKKITLKINND